MGQSTVGSTSSSLIRQVQANEPDAWRQLCRLYAPMVVQWCRQAHLQSADTADIVQEVFAAVCKNVGRFRRTSPQDSFRGWLWTITRNQVRMHLRQAARQIEAAGGLQAQQMLDELPQFFEEASHQDSQLQQHALLRRALRFIRSEFTDTTWQAFWRTTVDNLPGPDVAAELGLSPGAVRQAKYAVLQRLRNLLAGD